jgi:hypothetical protein
LANDNNNAELKRLDSIKEQITQLQEKQAKKKKRNNAYTYIHTYRHTYIHKYVLAYMQYPADAVTAFLFIFDARWAPASCAQEAGVIYQ